MRNFLHKLTVLLILIPVLPTVSFAQNKIRFSYDAGGNRVKKEIVVNKPANVPAQSRRAATVNTYNDVLNRHGIEIKSDEINGQIHVTVADTSVKDVCNITVYSSQGAIVSSKDVSRGYANLDLSDRPAGMYILNITVNGISAVWKITKK